jgi:hypothetical protein
MKLKKNYLLTSLSILAIYTFTISTWSLASTESKKGSEQSKPVYRDKNMDIKTFLSQSDLGEPYAIIGGALKHDGEPYLRNHFLIDIDKGSSPDIAMDISGTIDPTLKGVFSYVVTEFVPMDALAAKNSFTNIASLLKSNGKYISNEICTAKKIDEGTKKIANKSVKYSKGTAYYTSEIDLAHPVYIYYEGEMEKDELEKVCFSVIVTPLIEQAGFKDVKLIDNPYMHNRLKELGSQVIVATKK